MVSLLARMANMFIEIVVLEQPARRRVMVSSIADGRKEHFK